MLLCSHRFKTLRPAGQSSGRRGAGLGPDSRLFPSAPRVSPVSPVPPAGLWAADLFPELAPGVCEVGCLFRSLPPGGSRSQDRPTRPAPPVTMGICEAARQVSLSLPSVSRGHRVVWRPVPTCPSPEKGSPPSLPPGRAAAPPVTSGCDHRRWASVPMGLRREAAPGPGWSSLCPGPQLRG